MRTRCRRTVPPRGPRVAAAARPPPPPSPTDAPLPPVPNPRSTPRPRRAACPDPRPHPRPGEHARLPRAARHRLRHRRRASRPRAHGRRLAPARPPLPATAAGASPPPARRHARPGRRVCQGRVPRPPCRRQPGAPGQPFRPSSFPFLSFSSLLFPSLPLALTLSPPSRSASWLSGRPMPRRSRGTRGPARPLTRGSSQR